MKFKGNRATLLAGVLLVSVAVAISGGDFTVREATGGLTGGTAAGGDYTARFLLTASDKPGAGPNTLGGGMSANIGFFNSSVIGEVTPSGSDLQVPLTEGWNLLSLAVNPNP